MENKEKEIDLILVFKAVWDQKRTLIKWSIGGLIVGLVVAFSLPKEYQSIIKIAPESNSSSSSMGQLGGLASMMGISTGGASNGGIDESVYPEIVKSSPFISEFSSIEVPFEGQQITLSDYLIKEQKKAWWSTVLGAPMKFIGWIFSSETKPKEEVDDFKNPSRARRAFEGALSSKMQVESDKKTGLLTLKVTMQGPEISMVVADSLLEKLSRYMKDYYTAKASNDLTSSQSMLSEAKSKYYKADSLYASLVDRNQNLITKSAQIKVDRYKNERDLAFMVYQQLSQQVEANKITLQQQTPIATVIEPARMPNMAVSPNKKMIVIAFVFLSVLSAVAIALKEILFKNSDDQ